MEISLRSLFKNFSLDKLKKGLKKEEKKKNKVGNGVVTTLDPTFTTSSL